MTKAHIRSLTLLALVHALACSDDSGAEGTTTPSDASESETGDGPSSDGDGDPATGDGDGDGTTGDGDGDGDGDPATGDGDGDDPTGDGDGDPTTGAGECGDGTVDPSEQCDLGPDNDPGGACTPDCTIAVCGDGYVYEGFEDCDDANDDDEDGCDSSCVASSTHVYLTSTTVDEPIHRYSIFDDSWETITSPPATLATGLTNDGVHVFALGTDNMVYAYDPDADTWAEQMEGPGMNLAASPIGGLWWFPAGFYYLKAGQDTLYVYREGQWSEVELDTSGTAAGTVDLAADELYIRSRGRLGFQVIDTTTDSLARVIVDNTEAVEDSRTGSFYAGHFYVRAYDEPFSRLDALDGSKTALLGHPLSDNTATDTDFTSGRIYVAGFSPDTTSFQAYDTDEDVIIDLADSPGVAQHSTITVMRP